MAKQKKPVHRVQMTEGKRNIIHQLLEEYDIQTAEDIQEALKDLLGGTIKEMMEAEMDDHLGYQKSERSDNDDYRNGYKRKRVNSSYGSMEIEVPQDRKPTFQPQVVKKRQKDISDIDPRETMSKLTVGKQQMCEIAKAISHKAEVIIFDEPSAALTEKEIADLFVIIRDLREKNLGIVYISHRMDEIKVITDRVTVMRDGGYVGTLITKESTKEDIINMMVGRVIYEDPKEHSMVAPDAPVVLKVENLNAGKMVQDVSFELRKGEILGFSGLMGAGRTETARALFGADPKQSGKISIMDKQSGQLKEVTINTPQDAVKYGIGYLSEDRRRYGVVVQKSVNENTTLATMEQFTSGIFINKAKEKEVSEKYIKELATKTPNGDQLVVNLSGGNQQKVVIAKWLTRDSDILIFDEPTRGIDVGAKNEIYKLMSKLAAEGKSIIMISSEMTEILRMSDRIIVMCEGKVTGNIDISEATQEHIMDKATRNIN